MTSLTALSFCRFGPVHSSRGFGTISDPAPDPPLCSLRSNNSNISAAVTTAAAATALASLLVSTPTFAKSVLSTNTILRRYVATDSAAILRYSLPLPSERTLGASPPPIRRAQELLERLGVDMRARGAAGMIGGRKDLARLRALLVNERLDILLDVPARRRLAAADLLSKLERIVGEIESELGMSERSGLKGLFPPQMLAVTDALQQMVERRNNLSKRTNFDASALETLRQEALNYIGDIEFLAVEGVGLPYRIPRRYNALPRLIGRATVQMNLIKNNNGEWTSTDLSSVGKEVPVTAVLDGYSAPLTAGNFVDLVRRGYYNNTPVLATQRSFFAQLGERQDDDIDGFKDPRSGIRRQLPMEILIDGDPAPSYGGTLDELGVGDLQPALPISAYGAMAMVHSVEDANDASSQFYIFLLDPTSYQARSYGGSVLTGSISTFGYVNEGKHYLAQLEAGDIIKNVRVIAGEENFRESGDN